MCNELDDLQAEVDRLRQYKTLYDHALNCVDRVFQACIEIPNPILPDFCRIGEDKFAAVVRLAEAFKKAEQDRDELRVSLEQAQEDYRNNESERSYLANNVIPGQAKELKRLKQERDELREQLDRYRPIHGSERLPTKEDATSDGSVLEFSFGAWGECGWDYVKRDMVWCKMPPPPIDNTPPPSEPVESLDPQSTEPQKYACPAIMTIGQVARICKVEPRTVSKWFDSGRLKGYRIPGSQDRRITRNDLIEFLERNEMPLAGVVSEDVPSESAEPQQEPPCEPGYRFLEVGEVIQEGDQVEPMSKPNCWVKSHFVGKHVGCPGSGTRYRRPITTEDEVHTLRQRVAELEQQLAEVRNEHQAAKAWCDELQYQLNDARQDRIDSTAQMTVGMSGLKYVDGKISVNYDVPMLAYDVAELLEAEREWRLKKGGE